MANRKVYKTAKGRRFDLDTFLQNNSQTVSVGNIAGNAITNAKGDVLGKGGKSIIHKRSEQVRRFYRDELPVVKDKVSIKEDIVTKRQKVEAEEINLDDALSPADALAKLAEEVEETKTKTKTRKRTTKKDDS